MNEPNVQKGRLVIFSNRLPFVVQKVDGVLKTVPGSGGLVTALAPVLRNRGGVWIGWPGFPDGDENELRELFSRSQATTGFSLRPVLLSSEDIHLYYEGFSNEIIWPLFHEMPTQCVFEPKYWNSVQEVTKKFAQIAKAEVRFNDFLWVHDYHLLLLGRELRKEGIASQLAFFLHIPFPAPDTFLKLPWRFEVLRALLEYDLIGFQTEHDHRNFVQCLRKLVPDILIKSVRNMHACTVGQRQVRVGSFPISIDFEEFSRGAADRDVAEEAWISHEKLAGQKIILSVDRLDMTKGIPLRLRAIHDLLEKHPEVHHQVTFVQIVVPSRSEIPKYQELKKEIDRMVGEINSKFTQAGWVPIHYFFRSLSRKELLAFYRMSEIALVTPIRDGMNLVAKEYVASNVDEKGVLILSEFAGAASQLHREALLVNPYDIEGVSSAIMAGLMLPVEDRKKRMRRMRQAIRRQNIFWWVKLFLQAAISKELGDFPIIQEYVPTEPV